MNATLRTASTPRCLAVATGLTAALWGAAAVLVGALATDDVAGAPDRAVVRLCLVALLVATGWAWLQGLAGVADAWRGARPGHASPVRRLALVACGAALAGTLAGPAHADEDPMSGLPLPERAEGAGHHRPERVVVRPGDSLWALARDELGGRASDRQITDRWHAVYAANRAVVGPDPDLLRPGQVLRLTRQEEKR